MPAARQTTSSGVKNRMRVFNAPTDENQERSCEIVRLKDEVRQRCPHFISTAGLPTEGEADGAAPEVEAAQGQIEIVVRLVVLDGAEVTDVAAKSDVVRELRANTRAHIDTEV